MGDAKRRAALGLNSPLERTAAQLHDALMDAEHLRHILSMSEFHRERVLAALPGIILEFAPAGEGVEYDRARTWLRTVAEAVEARIRQEVP